MPTHRSGFDAELWRAQAGSTARDNPRAGQLAALEAGVLRQGMPRADVHRVLGEPDRQQPDADVYAIGASPMGISFESYRIEYRQGLVVGWGVQRQ